MEEIEETAENKDIEEKDRKENYKEESKAKTEKVTEKDRAITEKDTEKGKVVTEKNSETDRAVTEKDKIKDRDKTERDKDKDSAKVEKDKVKDRNKSEKNKVRVKSQIRKNRENDEKDREMGVLGRDLYVNSGYLFNSRVPFKETKLPLRILSAGTYQLISWPKLPTWRPRGRIDWQLLYIAAGEGHFVLDDKEVIVPAGNMVLYQPKQQQKYFYLGKDKTQAWFVHFTGRQVRNILEQYEIPLDAYILHTGLSREYEDLFRRMRDELLKCSSLYEEMLTFLFRELLVTMHRKMTENAPRISGFIQDEMERAKLYFEDHYNLDISIEQYATSRNMSTSWFNRSFRSAMGTSPMKFILEIRIRNAQILLETTDYTINDIAAIVGYDNPMYFSRLFRKVKGLSPSRYRKIYREKYLG